MGVHKPACTPDKIYLAHIWQASDKLLVSQCEDDEPILSWEGDLKYYLHNKEQSVVFVPIGC